jgi:hypothetical protein
MKPRRKTAVLVVLTTAAAGAAAAMLIAWRIQQRMERWWPKEEDAFDPTVLTPAARRHYEATLRFIVADDWPRGRYHFLVLEPDVVAVDVTVHGGTARLRLVGTDDGAHWALLRFLDSRQQLITFRDASGADLLIARERGVLDELETLLAEREL